MNTWDIGFSQPFEDCLPLVRYITKPKACLEYSMLDQLGLGYGGVRGTIELVPGNPTFDVKYKVYCTIIHVLKVCSFLKTLIVSLTSFEAAGSMKPATVPTTQAGWKTRHNGLQNRFILSCENWPAACKLRIEITCCQNTLEDCTRLCHQYGLLYLKNWFQSAGHAPPHLESHRLQLRLVNWREVSFL